MMAKKALREGRVGAERSVGSTSAQSMGLSAVVRSMKITEEQMGLIRASKAPPALNEVQGSNFLGCSLPEPDKRTAGQFGGNSSQGLKKATRGCGGVSRCQAIRGGTANEGRILAWPAAPIVLPANGCASAAVSPGGCERDLGVRFGACAFLSRSLRRPWWPEFPPGVDHFRGCHLRPLPAPSVRSEGIAW